ncbi:hypothetical protein EDM80_04185 [bacterium]|nr:MAG: hypothetical protein EDM80_04185 [bacterium]RIK63561.1 MAG: hypothetical protein DCC64_06875 [Planctomycetota bacterium]
MEKATWDKKKQEATVTMKEGKTIEKDAVVKAFEDSKFSVRSFAKEGEETKEEKKEEKKDGTDGNKGSGK